MTFAKRSDVQYKPDLSLHRRDELGRVVADAFLEHEGDFADVGDLRGRISVDDDEVGLLADGDRSDAVGASEVRRAVERADLDGLERRESALDEQLELALVGESGDHAAAARRIGAGEQRSAGAEEIHLELTRLGEERRVRRTRLPRGAENRRSNCSRSAGSSTSSPGGSGRPGTLSSNTVSVDVSATCRCTSSLISDVTASLFGSTAATDA